MTQMTALPTTAQEVIDGVAALVPSFRERATRTDELRSVPPETIAELRALGVPALLVPRERGGLQAGIRSLVDLTAMAAQGCPSTGWLAGLMAHTAQVVAKFPLETQQAVWTHGADRVIAGAIGVTARRVSGGYRISGRSPFASGVNNAEWVYLIGSVTDGEDNTTTPEMRIFLVDCARYTVADTWHTTGMRGTGSNTVVTEDVFVPAAQTISLEDAREGTAPGRLTTTSSIVALPWVATGSLVFAAAMLGAATGAYTAAVSSLSTKRGPGGRRTAESEHVQIKLANAAGRIDASRTVLHALADRADSAVQYTMRERAIAARDCALVAELLVGAIDALVDINGTSVFRVGSPVHQAWVDIHFAAAHQGLNPKYSGTHFSRLELGVDDPAPSLFH